MLRIKPLSVRRKKYSCSTWTKVNLLRYYLPRFLFATPKITMLPRTLPNFMYIEFYESLSGCFKVWRHMVAESYWALINPICSCSLGSTWHGRSTTWQVFKYRRCCYWNTRLLESTISRKTALQHQGGQLSSSLQRLRLWWDLNSYFIWHSTRAWILPLDVWELVSWMINFNTSEYVP